MAAEVGWTWFRERNTMAGAKKKALGNLGKKQKGSSFSFGPSVVLVAVVFVVTMAPVSTSHDTRK